MNSLANHNIIPHNGRNITIPILEAGFNKYINVGSDVAMGVGGQAVALSPIPNSQSFDLTDIDKHNAIEHDGSLSYVYICKLAEKKISDFRPQTG